MSSSALVSHVMLVRFTWNVGTNAVFTSVSSSNETMAAGYEEPLQQIVNFSVYCSCPQPGEEDGLLLMTLVPLLSIPPSG